MKKIAWLFSIIVSAVIANGQDKLPPAFEIKADTALRQDIDDKYWQLLEDPSGKLTIGQVSSASFDDKFHINNTRTKGYNYDIDTYWLRYRFKNTLTYRVKMALPENVANAQLYISQPNNKWLKKTTGVLLPWSQRDGLKRVHRFLFTIEPGQEILLYERDVFDFRFYKPQHFQFTIGFEDAAIKTLYVNNDDYYTTEVVYSLIMGILLLASFVNLMFYNIVREKVYLYFALFMLSYGVNDFVVNVDVLFREYPYFNWYLGVFTNGLGFFMMMHFVRYFLSTKTHTPRWDKLLILMSYLQFVAFIGITLIPPSSSYTTYLVILFTGATIVFICSPLLLVTLLFYIRKNTGPVRLGIFAALPLFTWFSLGYLYIFIYGELHELYKTPYPALYNWLVPFGNNLLEFSCFLILIVVFSGILFNRFRDLQQSLIQASLDREIERSQLIEKQNEELEKKVALRTAELSEQQEEITAQRDQLSATVDELKTTQQQLIQSEKLASLGELTAGIAHEIQNPLNFVNNFSEVSMELAVEIKDELKAGNIDEVIDIVDNIEQNLEKIIHHGKRADAIVKNMLQHSRNNSAEKQLTDINALADEYLRLSYHGLRAKDKSFNSDMKTDFDPSIPKVEMIGQDIGRVLLNLYNNAFYAVQQRKKAAGDNYKPEVKVSTRVNGRFVEVKVWDNGIGIPDSVKGKILQPFFTTKPTGEGTGLGLSLSYDIIVKGHGGTMDISSKEGEYTEFTINIPV